MLLLKLPTAFSDLHITTISNPNHLLSQISSLVFLAAFFVVSTVAQNPLFVFPTSLLALPVVPFATLPAAALIFFLTIISPFPPSVPSNGLFPRSNEHLYSCYCICFFNFQNKKRVTERLISFHFLFLVVSFHMTQ